MSGYLLDTQIVRYWSDGDSGEFPAVQIAAELRSAIAPLYVSAITLGEIGYGHAVNPLGAGPKRDEFVNFVRDRLPQILSVSKHTAEPYGQIRAKLFERFPPKGGWPKKRRPEQLYHPTTARELGIDENDLWIVAQALERNLILVTADRMQKIQAAVNEIAPSFVIEDWTASIDGAAS